MPRKRRKTPTKKSANRLPTDHSPEPVTPEVESTDDLPIAARDEAANPVVDTTVTPAETKTTTTAPAGEAAVDSITTGDTDDNANTETDDGEIVVEVEDGPSDISELYDLDDNTVDMTKMEQTPRRRRWILLVSVFVLLLLVVAYFGYRVFSKDFGDSGTGTGVTVTIDVPENTASGDLVTIEVEYENTKKVDLRSAEVEVFYPNGFYFKNATVSSENDSGRIFQLGEVKSGTGGKIEITGQLVGTKGDNKHFSSLLTYQPANFSTNFQVTAEADVQISSSIVELTVDVPAQIQAGQELEYTLTFTNTAKVDLENVKILVTYPEGFTYTDADVEPRSSTNEWRIDALAAGATDSITIRGTLGGKSGVTKEFDAQLGVVEIDNSFTVQSQLSSLVLVINPEMEISLSAPEVVAAEEEMTLTVTLKNTSEAEIHDLKVRLDFTGNLVKDATYAFDPVETLSAFGQQELTYTTTIKKSENITDKAVDIKAVIAKGKVEGREVEFSSEAAATVKLQGKVVTTAQGRYFDEGLTKIGVGPLPPVVSRDTTYVIWWDVANGSNAIDDFSMSTTLPADVIWEDDASANLSYDSSTRRVSYQTDTLKADASQHLEFTLTVSPTNDDVNKLLVLTQETAVAGTDSFTNQPISQQLDRITTDLPNDEGASGKGVVEGS